MPTVVGDWDVSMSREERWRRSVLSAGDAGREEGRTQQVVFYRDGGVTGR